MAVSRIALVGLRSVGKTTLAKQLVGSGLLPNGARLQEFEFWFSNNVGDGGSLGLPRLYLNEVRAKGLQKAREDIGRSLTDWHNDFLLDNGNPAEPAVFALSPLVGRCSAWSRFRRTVRVIWLEKPADQILHGIRLKHDSLVEQFKSDFPDLAHDRYIGCWDVGFLFDHDMNRVEDRVAIETIERTSRELQQLYDSDAVLSVTASTGPQDVFAALGWSIGDHIVTSETADKDPINSL